MAEPMLLTAILLFASAVLPATSTAASTWALKDGTLTATFHTDPAASSFGSLSFLAAAGAADSLLVPGDAYASWSASFVAEGHAGVLPAVDGSCPAGCDRSVVAQTATSLVLRWANVPVSTGTAVNVTLSITLKAGKLEHDLSFARAVAATGSMLGLWEWTLRPSGTVLLAKGGSTFKNTGFGQVDVRVCEV